MVVIDALDECQVPAHVAAFFSILPKLNDLKDVQLRVFVTSRPESPVIKGFRPIGNGEIILHQIERSIIEHDISIFLRERLQRIKDDHGLARGWPGEETIQALVNMAVPLFIYAATIYRFIDCEGELPDDRLRAILSLHSSDGIEEIDSEYSKLTGIYLPVLKHIVSQKKPKELEGWMERFSPNRGCHRSSSARSNSIPSPRSFFQTTRKSREDLVLSSLSCQCQKTVMPLFSFFISRSESF